MTAIRAIGNDLKVNSKTIPRGTQPGIKSFLALLVSSMCIACSSDPSIPLLDGEQLLGTSGAADTSSCANGSGNLIFTIAGNASGPYPGTFTGNGTVTIVNYVVVAFNISFRVDSKSARISGTETLAPSAPNTGLCLSTYGSFSLDASYVAIVANGRNPVRDKGSGLLTLSAGAAGYNVFGEALGGSGSTMPSTTTH
jgi:hypothetical protein